MTYEEFRKKHPATRCWQKFDHEQRADLASSHRLTTRQRQAIGEYYYLHPMTPNSAFPTAKAATTAAFKVYEASDDKPALSAAILPPKVVTVTTEEMRERFEVPPLRFAVPLMRVRDSAEEDAAEIEGTEQARRARHANIGS